MPGQAPPGLSQSEMQAYLFAPPRAQGGGVSQAELQRRSSQAVATPKGLTTTIEDAVPDTPEAREQRSEAAVGYHSAVASRLTAEEEAAKAQAAAFRAQRLQAEDASAKMQAKMAAADDAFRKEQTRLQSWSQSIQTREVDPGRIFRGAGAIAGIGFIISDALGGYAAALTGRSHTSMLQQVIDRDIRLQESEIARQGAGAHNALGQLLRQYDGDRDQAQQALRYLMTSAAQAQAQEIGAATKATQLPAQGQELLAKLEMDRVKAEQDIAAKAAGKVSTKYEQGFALPGVGGGGVGPGGRGPGGAGAGAISPHELKARADAIAATNRALGGDRGLSMPDPKRKELLSYGEERRKTQDGYAALEALAKESGLEKVNGEYVLPKGKDIPGHGATGWVPYRLMSAEGKAVDEAKNNAKVRVRQAITGAHFSPTETEEIVKPIYGATDEDLVRGMNRAKRAIDKQVLGIDAQYGSEVRQSWETQLQSVQTENAQRSAPSSSPQREEF
jgi:hypothetical protein